MAWGHAIIASSKQSTAKSENEVIARCTGDTHVISDQDKGILRRP